MMKGQTSTKKNQTHFLVIVCVAACQTEEEVEEGVGEVAEEEVGPKQIIVIKLILTNDWEQDNVTGTRNAVLISSQMYCNLAHVTFEYLNHIIQ